jgi:hypothetical protein
LELLQRDRKTQGALEWCQCVRAMPLARLIRHRRERRGRVMGSASCRRWRPPSEHTKRIEEGPGEAGRCCAVMWRLRDSLDPRGSGHSRWARSCGRGMRGRASRGLIHSSMVLVVCLVTRLLCGRAWSYARAADRNDGIVQVGREVGEWPSRKISHLHAHMQRTGG